MNSSKFLTPLLLLALLLSACAAPTPTTGGLRVVTTTNILGDVVQSIGGEHIHLTVLLPTGADPHSFEPTPQDLAAIESADIIFINGLGLEEFLGQMIENTAQAQVVAVSEGLPNLIPLEEEDHEEGEDDHEHEGEFDPHVWMNPLNVLNWVETISQTLSQADPANAALYQTNAETYAAEIQALHTWAQEQIKQVPPAQRQMVTDHLSFGYFGQAYQIEIIGALLPAASTLAEPSAQQLAALEDAIRAAGVKTIFVGFTVNPALAERVAHDTGTQLVYLYTGSLSAPDGDAPTYIEMMRYNVNAVVNAWANQGD